MPFGDSEIEQSIPDRFRAQVQQYGDRLAVKSGTDAYSYRALDQLSSRIAHAILDRIGNSEEPVLLLLRQGAALIAAVLGTLKAGKIYVPQHHSAGTAAIDRVLRHCDAPLIVTDSHNRNLARELAGQQREVLDIDQLPDSLLSEDPGISPSPHSPAYIYYTSGSTGTPKGVVDCHRNVLHNVLRYTNSFSIGADDRLSLVQLPAFSGAVSSMFCALLNGASVFPFDLPQAGIRELADWVRTEKLTMFHSVPVIFEQLISVGVASPTLRVIRLEGDKALPKHLHLFRQVFDEECWLVNGLGTTETGLVRQFFFNPSMPFDGDTVPIGYPVRDMEIVLSDDTGTPVNPGKAGEICVRSRYLATGYWNRDDLTGAAFTDIPESPPMRLYRTGDMGRMTVDGCLYHLGRKTFQVRIRGQHIDTGPIEAALLSIGGVRDAVVAVHEGRPGRQQIIAYVIAADGMSFSADMLRRDLAKTLPALAVPSKFVFLDALPLDGNRKVSHKNLPPPGTGRPALSTPFKGPTTALEKMLASGFGRVLGLNEVGVEDDFYDLGGDSLALIELVLWLEETFATTVPTELFLDGVSVSAIVEWRQDNNSGQPLVVLNSAEAQPPLFLFHDFAGHVLDYAYLAANLHVPRTVYGLQRTDALDLRTAALSLPELAARYVADIRQVQPQGPYLLGGQCFGGLLAFEAARQLRAGSAEIQLVILIDTAFPRGWVYRLLQRMSLPRHWRRMESGSPGYKAAYIGGRLKNILRSAATTVLRRFHQQSGNGLPALLQRPTDAHRFAEAQYRAGNYDGPVALICPGPLHNQRGWEAVCHGGLEIIELPLESNRDASAHPTSPTHIAALLRAVDRLIAA